MKIGMSVCVGNLFVQVPPNITPVIPVPNAPVATAATSITSASFVANWNTSSTATSYLFDCANDVSFETMLINYIVARSGRKFLANSLNSMTILTVFGPIVGAL